MWTPPSHLLNPPLFIGVRGVRFLKNHKRGGSRFSCKNGGGRRVFYIVGESVEAGRGKHRSQPGMAYERM